VQLEVASLAQWQDWSAAFEERLTPGQPPVDVVLRRGDQLVPIEVKVVVMSQHNTTVLAESRRFDFDVIMDLLERFDVYLGGTLPAMPSTSGRRALLDAMEPIAAMVSEDHKTREVDWHGARLTLTSGRTMTSVELNMPIPLVDEAQRLSSQVAEKARQVTRSGARWLRLDALGGYMRFSDWWDKPLADQLKAIVEDPGVQWSNHDLDGVILSSGLVVRTITTTETATHPSGALALTCKVTPLHVRTTVLVPITSSAHSLGAELLTLYAGEPDWLGTAVAAAGLPPLMEAVSAPPAPGAACAHA
jgi:hypothetical protein